MPKRSLLFPILLLLGLLLAACGAPAVTPVATPAATGAASAPIVDEAAVAGGTPQLIEFYTDW